MCYRRDETSKLFAWFFIVNMGAQAATGLITYGALVLTYESFFDSANLNGRHRWVAMALHRKP